MSVRLALLTLLTDGPRYGAQLRSEFEGRTGGTWPLNIGQVYTTLGRLERDELVVRGDDEDAVAAPEPEPGAAPDDDGRTRYHLTAAGRAEVDRWWTRPVERSGTPRDELVIKLALAVTAPGVDVAAVVQTQRAASLTHLRDLTRLKRGAAAPGEGSREDLAWALVLEHHIFTVEGEVRWLDHVEARLTREASAREEAPPPAVPTPRPRVSRAARR